MLSDEAIKELEGIKKELEEKLMAEKARNDFQFWRDVTLGLIFISPENSLFFLFAHYVVMWKLNIFNETRLAKLIFAIRRKTTYLLKVVHDFVKKE